MTAILLTVGSIENLEPGDQIIIPYTMTIGKRGYQLIPLNNKYHNIEEFRETLSKIGQIEETPKEIRAHLIGKFTLLNKLSVPDCRRLSQKIGLQSVGDFYCRDGKSVRRGDVIEGVITVNTCYDVTPFSFHDNTNGTLYPIPDRIYYTGFDTYTIDLKTYSQLAPAIVNISTDPIWFRVTANDGKSLIFQARFINGQLYPPWDDNITSF